MNKLQEKEKFLKTYSLSRPNPKEIVNLNESVLEILSTWKRPGPGGFTGEVYKTFKELMLILFKLFQKAKEEGTYPNSYYENSNNLIPKQKHYTTTKENYRPIFLKNLDTKILKISSSFVAQWAKDPGLSLQHLGLLL